MATRITPETLARSGSEHGEQSALFCWAAHNVGWMPALQSMFAVPNGGARDGATAARLRAEGVKRGVPDVMLPVVRLGPAFAAGLFIEMKRRKGGYTTEDQDWYHAFLRKQGYVVAVCHTWQEARDVIILYLTGMLCREEDEAQ